MREDPVAHLLVVQDGGLDLQLRRLEEELHEGELDAALQLLGLHLHVRLVDPEGLPRLDVGDEQRELGVEVEQQHPQPLAHHDPVLGEGPATEVFVKPRNGVTGVRNVYRGGCGCGSPMWPNGVIAVSTIVILRPLSRPVSNV